MLIRNNQTKVPSVSEKIKLVREYEQSGLSAAEYCREAGIAGSTFSKWARLYKDRGQNLPFAEVGVQPVSEYEIKLLNGRHLIVRGLCAAKQVSALVRELEEC